MAHMFSWMNPKPEVRKAAGYKGVFVKENINKGEKLTIFGGRGFPAIEEIGDYAMQIDEDFVIDGMSIHSGEFIGDTFFFNHSCEPDAGINGQILLVAMRDIQKDEEVTFDYAMCLHETKGSPPYRMECRCGHANCRKVITENDIQFKRH